MRTEGLCGKGASEVGRTEENLDKKYMHKDTSLRASHVCEMFS